jgi:glutaconate CoA-transferase subunit A
LGKREKRISLKDVPTYVQDGDRVWTGGWTVVRKPMAMVYELIRSGKKGLHLVANPGGPEIDLLIGCGCVAKTESNYIGHEVFGHPYNFRRKLEAPVEGEEFYHDDWTVMTGALRIMAGAMGIPFIPTKSLKGSDIINPELDGFKSLRGKDDKVPKKKFVLMEDPFWEGETVVLIPALRPDVCLIHAQEVGEDGTVRISGGKFLDYYAAVAAKTTIVSAERIVPKEQMAITAEENSIPGEVVDAILEVPYGAHPTALQGFYDNDPWWFKEYLAASRTDEKMNAWRDKWIYGTESFTGYLEQVGTSRLEQLKADSTLGYNPDIRRRLDKLEEVE